MIKISKLADYATVIMGYLAQTPEKRYSAAQVAKALQITLPTVSKVLKLLNEAQLVNSERGVNGGYQLVRAPEQISVAEVITAIDGKPAMTECSKEEALCSRNAVCALRENWQIINRAIMDLLDNLSLVDMNRPLTQSLQFHETVQKIKNGDITDAR